MLHGVRKFLPVYCFLVLGADPSLRAQRGAITLPRNIIQLTDRAAMIVHGRVVYAHVEPHPRYHNLDSIIVTMSAQHLAHHRPKLNASKYLPLQECPAFH